MARIKIQLPQQFDFSIIIPVRITDLNYGGHVGNDTILSLIHEARMQFLTRFGYTEMDFEGSSLIMSDVGIEFKSELFYGDTVKAYVAVKDISRVGFDVYYKLAKNSEEIIVAIAKTALICYDYQNKKVVSIPAKAREKFTI